MKKIIATILLFIFSTLPGQSKDFAPYLGVDIGLNIAQYTSDYGLDENYYNGTINAGARIGSNFGIELFYTHTLPNEVDYVFSAETITNQVYYNAFGFDIYAYYNLPSNFDFFTSFGVANYKTYNKLTYTTPFDEVSAKTDFTNTTTRFGIGLLYTFSDDNVSGLIQYQYAPINNEIINTISEFSIGFRYIF